MKGVFALRAYQPSLVASSRPPPFRNELHGNLIDAETLVFTRSQYRRRLYASPAYLTMLKSLLATSSVLFLGYSLGDAYLNELRAELVEAFAAEAAGGAVADRRPLAWAVLEDVSDVARAYYGKHEGLGVIAYQTGDGGADHRGFDAILARLYAETNPVHRLGQLLQGRRLLWFDPAPAHNELGRRLLLAAVREVDGGTRALSGHLLEVVSLDEAVRRLDDQPPFDLILSHWGHGAGPDGVANGEGLLRAVAVRRAAGKGTAPVVIFAGPEHAGENRERAVRLGAVGFAAWWGDLMAMIERSLGGVVSGLVQQE